MPDFLVVRLNTSSSTVFQEPFCLGMVELRPAKFDSPAENEALRSSVNGNKESVNLDFAARLALVVTNVNDEVEAHLNAQSVFEEVLDVMKLDSYGIARYSLLNSGFTRNLSTGEVIPRIVKDMSLGMIFKIESDRYPLITIKEHLLANRNDEICYRLLKSLHWSRHASSDRNLQMNILFNWFSIEALFKIDINDNIGPKTLFAMGFPVGQYAARVSPALMTSLQGHAKYKPYRAILQKKMEELREYRNNSVHYGFRHWDLPLNDLKRMAFIAKSACNSCQSLAISGIYNGSKTLEDLWAKASDIIDKNTNLVNHVHNNFIFSLDNQTYLHIYD